MHQQFLASATTQLNYLTSNELREYIDDDDKLDNRIDEILKSLESEKDAIIIENRVQAEANLQNEPRLIETRSRINDLIHQGKELGQQVQTKMNEIKSKSSNINPETILALLQTSAAESEEKSDKIAEDFLSNSLSIDEFLEQFKPSRTEMHLRKLKAEKMQELLRQGAHQPHGNGPPHINYGGAGFYGSPMSGAAPYPNMPLMQMPLPPGYNRPY